MIIIPMAGLSSRFTKAGYDKPKYMLPLKGKTVFYHAIMSFHHYFENEKFLFIARDVKGTFNFIRQGIKGLGIRNYQIIELNDPTAGQAETVELGIKKANIKNDESLTIFNIDSFRLDFEYPKDNWFKNCDGYLEVFKGKGDNWSYVLPQENNAESIVLKTTEKDPVSDLCSNGLYYFKYAKDFLRALKQERDGGDYKELYIAPLYNYLIQKNKKIYYNLIPKEKTIFCGVPQEYIALYKNNLVKFF